MKIINKKLEFRDMKIGDIVISENNREYYIIIDIKFSRLHNHPKLICFYPQANTQKSYYLHECYGKRQVIRLK